MPSITVVLGLALALTVAGAGLEGYLLKSSWQREAATKQALAQAAQSLKDIHDAQAERTGVDTGCSGKSIDDIIARLHSATPCTVGR